MVAHTERDERPLTVKSLGWLIVTSGAAVTLLATLYAWLLVPALLNEARSLIDKRIEHHEQFPHRAGVSREELAALIKSLDNLATKAEILELRRRLERIEAKVDK